MTSVYASEDGQSILIDLGNGSVEEFDYREAGKLMRGIAKALENADYNVTLIKQYGTSNDRAVAYARHKEWFGEKLASDGNADGKRIYDEANKETV